MKIVTSIRALGLAGVLACAPLFGGAAAVDAQTSAASEAHRPFILMFELTVKADREQDFLKLLRQMKARVVHQDHGNIRYELFAVGPARAGRAGPPGAATQAQHQYVFLEEWRDQAAATAHGKWAAPIVRTQWREMTESMRAVPLDRVPLL